MLFFLTFKKMDEKWIKNPKFYWKKTILSARIIYPQGLLTGVKNLK
jgi:hypothetical protein